MENSLFFLYLWGKLERVAPFFSGKGWMGPLSGPNNIWLAVNDLGHRTAMKEPPTQNVAHWTEKRKRICRQLLWGRRFQAGTVETSKESCRYYTRDQQTVSFSAHLCDDCGSQSLFWALETFCSKTQFSVESYKCKTGKKRCCDWIGGSPEIPLKT